MRKLLAVAAILATLTAAGCSVAANAGDTMERGEMFIPELELKDGYYLSDNDESYIHIENGQIELCNYDIESEIASDYEEHSDNISLSREEYAENCLEDYTAWSSLQDFTPVTWYKFGDNDEDYTMLVLNYDFAVEKGAYTGYQYNSDGSISKLENTYTYSGETL